MAGITTGGHILILNRFAAEVGCRYADYLDHRTNRVGYLTMGSGQTGAPAELAEFVTVVDDLGDWAAVAAAALERVELHGAFDRIVALFERDQETAAALRELLGVPGPGPAEVARVRDKLTMKALVAATGLRVPRSADAESVEQVRKLAAEVGFPVVLKPRDGSGSQGIILVSSARSLDETLTGPMPGYLCEEFITGVMYQVDGIIQDGVVRVLRAARVLTSCLDYALGNPFGSVANDDQDLERRLVGYSQMVLGALDVRDSAFHLEVFAVPPTGEGEYDDLVFLEVAARPGGAEVPAIWREVYQVDLQEAAVRLQLGESPRLRPIEPTREAGGYLLMPEPPSRPCRVRSVLPLIEEVPAMYAEILPEPGAILNGTGGPKETGGRYRFRAATGEQIEQAINAVVAGYRLDWEPVTDYEAVVRPVGRVQSVARP